MTAAVIRVTSRCDNRCVFCAQRGLAHPEPDRLGTELYSARARTDAVVFVGGEPGLVDEAELLAVVAQAKEVGFRRICIQTNGRKFSKNGRLDELVRAGLTHIHLSIHGANPAIHDYHTGVAGSFEQTFTALRTARSLSVTVGVTTVLTRSNYRMLEPIRRLLETAEVNAWNMLIPRTAGAMVGAFDRTMPRLAMALPFALHALNTANNHRLPTFIQGAPACLLGPMANRALEDEPRAYAPVCAQCLSRGHCPGVDEEYLARFRGDELRARETAPPHSNQPELRMLFLGAGEPAPAQPSASEPEPLTSAGSE